MRVHLTALVAAAAGVVAVSAATAETPRYSLGDLAFLQGEWRGEADGQSYTEYWTEGGAGAMAGVFKLARGESYAVVELMMISDEPSGPVLRFKHHRKDYTTWEGDGPPQTLRLSHAEPSRADFVAVDPASNILSLHYTRARGALTATVVLRADDDPAKQERFSFVYRRR